MLACKYIGIQNGILLENESDLKNACGQMYCICCFMAKFMEFVLP